MCSGHAINTISHRLWRERFQSDPTVLQRPLRLNNTTFTVIGVAAPDFEGTTFLGTDIWMPMSMAGPIRGFTVSQVGGRLVIEPVD